MEYYGVLCKLYWSNWSINSGSHLEPGLFSIWNLIILCECLGLRLVQRKLHVPGMSEVSSLNSPARSVHSRHSSACSGERSPRSVRSQEAGGFSGGAEIEVFWFGNIGCVKFVFCAMFHPFFLVVKKLFFRPQKRSQNLILHTRKGRRFGTKSWT